MSAWHTLTFYADLYCADGMRPIPVQVFEGNVDSYTVKHYYLDNAVLARYVKFHTVQWHRHPSMRVEIIGCQGRLQLSFTFTALYHY